MSLSEVAEDTLAITTRGEYVAPSGRTVSIRVEVDRAIAGTTLFRPGDLSPSPAPGPAPRVEVTSETTASAARRLVETEGLAGVAVLNFASALEVGGGFLRGAKAQEEDLCRCSALYPCLERQSVYYDTNRAAKSHLYTDHLIWSPAVPFFRDDDYDLLERLFCVSVITAPAPYANGLRPDPDPRPVLRETLRRRAALVLTVAARFRHRVLVLGAWGCGAFGNDPEVAAGAFAEALEPARGHFDRVVFAVWDRGGPGANFKTFNARFGKA